MELKKHLLSLSFEERVALARACDTSIGHLSNVAHGHRPCSPLLASMVEAATGGLVMRWSLRLQDWHLIWPELTSRADAPCHGVTADQPATEVQISRQEAA